MYSIKWRLNSHVSHVGDFDSLKSAFSTWQVLKNDHPNCIFTLVKKGAKL
jgi:hypothetical protein